jgi:hypothetical protein
MSLASPAYPTRSRRRLMSRLSYQACGPDQGPLLVVVPMRDPVGPISTVSNIKQYVEQ